ncbi:MAG: PhoH-like ATPase [Flavobacteriaceae bacterium]|jgi:PhoH-like ATPase
MKEDKKIKTFVLDTSVIIHDHNCWRNFSNNNLVIPFAVIQKLDSLKSTDGSDSKTSFAAREFIRFLDTLHRDVYQEKGTLISKELGMIRITTDEHDHIKKADDRIINTAELLSKNEHSRIVLVTKDRMMRIKARRHAGLFVEDYHHDSVTIDKRYTGRRTIENVPDEVIDSLHKKNEIDSTIFKSEEFTANEFLILKNDRKSVLATFQNNKLIKIGKDDVNVCGIKALNAEQAFALNALLNPNIQIITLTGKAGTGKTLLSIAAGIHQEEKFKEINYTKNLQTLGKDIGYLPGDENDKTSPYMQSLYDNLGVLKEHNDIRIVIDRLMIDGKISTPVISFFRGRTFFKRYLILDEAQNCTPHEVKTIITRAGEGTKIIVTGDVRQIDTDYLDENSNGLSYLIDRFKGQDIYAHLQLCKGERSELSNLAGDLL